MSKVDWSLAPEGATHWAMGESIPVWFKDVRKGISFQFMNEGRGYRSSWMIATGDPDLDLIERPKQPQAWSGPEDGLPPIGLEVEATYDDGSYSWGYWLNTKVLCYGEERTFVNQLSRGTENTWCEGAITSAGLKYRPIKTAEQLAAEKKGRDVTDMLCIVTSSELKGRGLSAQLEALYDAGFKREAV